MRGESPGAGASTRTGATTKISRHQAPDLTDQSSRLVVARAVAHAPAGRRKRWLLLVEACPICSGAHYHLTQVAEISMRRSGCGSRGRRYLVVVPSSEWVAA